ncbi:MAG: hypothetical protein ACOH5I_09635 [Oligoflexus sp.]
MLKRIFLACLFLGSMQAKALDFNRPISGDTYYTIFANGSTVPSKIEFSRGFRDGAASKGKYSYGNRNGEIQITKFVFNPITAVYDEADIERLEGSGVNLSSCEFVILAKWLTDPASGSRTIGRVAWCYLKVAVAGENLAGIFWASDRPTDFEFAGEWSGKLRN